MKVFNVENINIQFRFVNIIKINNFKIIFINNQKKI